MTTNAAPRVRVRPAEGRRVRHPADGRPIPAEGAELPHDAFVRRLLRDGDLEIAPSAPAERAPGAAAAEGEGERPAAVASTTSTTSTTSAAAGAPRRRGSRD